MPYVQELREALPPKKSKSGSRPQVWIKASEAETRFNVEPARFEAPEGEEPKCDAEAGESPPFHDLFWKIYQGEKADGVGCLTLMHAELQVPVSCCQIKDANLRAGPKKPSGSITVWVPYLTNLEELRIGDPLWCRVDPLSGLECAAGIRCEKGIRYKA